MKAIICDLSELTGIWGAEAPDIMIGGAILFPAETIEPLQNDIRKIKGELLGSEYYPIKWNVMDLKRACRTHDLPYNSEMLKKNSNELRHRVLSLLPKYEASLFYSLIVGYSNRKEILESRKILLISYAFSNLLMRFGLNRKDAERRGYSQLIMDWPESNKRDPFISEYLSAWKYGRSENTKNPVIYKSGPLKDLGFSPTIYFGVTDCDELLQLTDLAVGAFRVFVDYSMDKYDINYYGVQIFKSIMNCIHEFGNNFGIRYGISISPQNSVLIPRLQKAFITLKE